MNRFGGGTLTCPAAQPHPEPTRPHLTHGTTSHVLLHPWHCFAHTHSPAGNTALSQSHLQTFVCCSCVLPGQRCGELQASSDTQHFCSMWIYGESCLLVKMRANTDGLKKTNKSKQTTSNHHSNLQTDTAPTKSSCKGGRETNRALLPTACLTAEWMGCTSLIAT